jgi:hypothetical protein
MIIAISMITSQHGHHTHTHAPRLLRVARVLARALPAERQPGAPPQCAGLSQKHRNAVSTARGGGPTPKGSRYSLATASTCSPCPTDLRAERVEGLRRAAQQRELRGGEDEAHEAPRREVCTQPTRKG